MKSNSARTLIIIGATLTFCFFQAVAVKASPVNLGDAGNYAILEIGSGNVSLAAAPPNGHISGNVGAAGGKLSDGGSLPIKGNVNLAGSAKSSGLAGNVTGTINTGFNLSSAISDAISASTTAAGMASSGGGSTFTSINLAKNQTLNLTPGVYNLSNFKLKNGDVVNLAAGGTYVFNISGTLSLNSAEVLAASGLSAANVLFNITGTKGVGFSGGLNNECIFDGTILAPDSSISLTPGCVEGSIISGENINIASGGSVAGGGQGVPDAGSSALLLGIACGCLALFNLGVKRFRA